MSVAALSSYSLAKFASLVVPATTNAVEAHAGTVACSLVSRYAGERQLCIPYEIQGPVNAPVVVVAGGISGHRHVCANANDAQPGWWESQVGPQRAINTARVRVLTVDWVGADGALDAPIDTTDQADAIAAVLDALEIAHIAVFVGASYGAMVGLQFAARHGQRLGHLVAISGAHAPHPYATACRALQRSIVRSGVAEPEVALSLARQLAMLTYRTPEEFAARFAQAPHIQDDRAHCASEGYLAACGERYADNWTPTAFLRLSESVDLHLVEPASVCVPTTFVVVSEDRLVPAADMYLLAEKLGARRVIHYLRSLYGHDAFLKEDALISEVLQQTLDAALGASA